MMLPGWDIWRVGLARTPLADILAAGRLPADGVTWLPPRPLGTFAADPFGLWRGDRLHLFVEAYDYRDRHGVIEHLELDQDLQPRSAPRVVLREPWHLSYPQVFEHDGEVWMLPEAHRSGALTLYRAAPFPDAWEPVVRLELDTPAIDATPFRHDGLWWLAYSPTGPQAHKQGRLHLAFAEDLKGPWRVHPGNPVRIDRASSRPGGTAFTNGSGRIVLPVQDCTRTYGGAARALTIHALAPDRFEAESGPLIAPPAMFQGLHTLSACGPVTLFDVKRVERSLALLKVRLQRAARA